MPDKEDYTPVHKPGSTEEPIYLRNIHELQHQTDRIPLAPAPQIDTSDINSELGGLIQGSDGTGP